MEKTEKSRERPLVSGEQSSALELLLLGRTTILSVSHESKHVAHPTVI